MIDPTWCVLVRRVLRSSCFFPPWRCPGEQGIFCLLGPTYSVADMFRGYVRRFRGSDKSDKADELIRLIGSGKSDSDKANEMKQLQIRALVQEYGDAGIDAGEVVVRKQQVLRKGQVLGKLGGAPRALEDEDARLSLEAALQWSTTIRHKRKSQPRKTQKRRNRHGGDSKEADGEQAGFRARKTNQNSERAGAVGDDEVGAGGEARGGVAEEEGAGVVGGTIGDVVDVAAEVVQQTGVEVAAAAGGIVDEGRLFEDQFEEAGVVSGEVVVRRGEVLRKGKVLGMGEQDDARTSAGTSNQNDHIGPRKTQGAAGPRAMAESRQTECHTPTRSGRGKDSRHNQSTRFCLCPPLSAVSVGVFQGQLWRLYRTALAGGAATAPHFAEALDYYQGKNYYQDKNYTTTRKKILVEFCQDIFDETLAQLCQGGTIEGADKQVGPCWLSVLEYHGSRCRNAGVLAVL